MTPTEGGGNDYEVKKTRVSDWVILFHYIYIHMKVIINENQMGKLLKNSIKENGVVFVANLIGGIDTLLTTLNINSPMDFLHLFDDLDVVQSEEEEDWTLFRYKKGNNLMVYDRKNEFVYIKNDEIWLVLRNGFGLNYYETQELTKTWLDDVYNLRGITTIAKSFYYG